MATTLIPILSAHIIKDEHDSVWQLVSTVINLALLLVAAVGIVAAIFAPQVIRVVAPGFDTAQVDLAARLMRLVLIQTLLFTASGILMGVLRAYQHFLLPAVAPLCYTMSRILGTLFLAPRWGIFGLAWGGVAGAVIYLLVLVPGLVRYRAHWTPLLTHPDLHAVLSLMGPRMMGLGATYVTFVLPTYFGSQLAAGAISSYEYAWRLMQFPETIIGTALGITVFPTLSALANTGNRENLRHTASWALRLVLALAIPAAVGLFTIGESLTVLFLQRGAFDAAATEQVARALRFFALGLVTHSALEVASRLFYAQRDMWTPFLAALGGLAVNVTLSWLLLPTLAQGGIALANSLGAGVQVASLMLVARKRLGGIEGRALATTLVRTMIAAALMASAIWGFLTMFPGAGIVMHSLGSAALGAGTYLVAALLLGNAEIRDLPGLLLHKGRQHLSAD
jgi:putative peptidoglycan lipid II flippase